MMTGARTCGGCAACCEALPVDDRALKKRAFTCCPHIRGAFETAGPGCTAETLLPQNEPVVAAIDALLDHAPFVLWRQRGPDGRQLARVITRGADNRNRLEIGPLTEASYDLGTEIERWARLDRLMAERAR